MTYTYWQLTWPYFSKFHVWYLWIWWIMNYNSARIIDDTGGCWATASRLCSLSRVESGVQILSIYANYATWAASAKDEPGILIYLNNLGSSAISTSTVSWLLGKGPQEVAHPPPGPLRSQALFATSTQGQAQGDSLRSSGSRRTVSMLLVSVQPLGHGNHRWFFHEKEGSDPWTLWGFNNMWDLTIDGWDFK